MSKGLKALKSLEKIVSKLYGMDIAYDEKTFNLFCIIGKELNALEILKPMLKGHIELNVIELKHINSTHYEVKVFDAIYYVSKDNYDLLKEVLL